MCNGILLLLVLNENPHRLWSTSVCACVCLYWVCVCACVSFQASRSVVFHWGKSTLSISCHVWLPSVVTDNTVGSATAKWPNNGHSANGMMVARHATLALTNQKCFTERNLAKECTERHLSRQNLFLLTDWKCQTVLPNAGETFTELIYFSLFPSV